MLALSKRFQKGFLGQLYGALETAFCKPRVVWPKLFTVLDASVNKANTIIKGEWKQIRRIECIK